MLVKEPELMGRTWQGQERLVEESGQALINKEKRECFRDCFPYGSLQRPKKDGLQAILVIIDSFLVS